MSDLTGMDLLYYANKGGDPENMKVVVDWYDRTEAATDARYDAETNTLTIYVE